MSRVGSSEEPPGWSEIDLLLQRRREPKTLTCSLIQLYYPARFVETMQAGRPSGPMRRGPIVLRPLHYLIHAVMAEPGDRFSRKLRDIELTRYDLRFEYPFLSIYRRNPRTSLIKTWDVGDRRRWALSGEEQVANVTAGFLYPDWTFPNWDESGDTRRIEHRGKQVLDASLICRVKSGQPIPGGVWKANEVRLRFDLNTGLMISRVAMLQGQVVEESRLVNIRSFTAKRS